LAQSVGRSEEPGGFTVAFGIACQYGKALEEVGYCRVHIDGDCAGERFMGVAFGLLGLTLGDSHAGARNQGQRQVDSARY